MTEQGILVGPSQEIETGAVWQRETAQDNKQREELSGFSLFHILQSSTKAPWIVLRQKPIGKATGDNGVLLQSPATERQGQI